MYDIIFLTSPTPEQIEQIILLYRLEGWWTTGPFDPDHVVRLIAGSHCFAAAIHGNEIIGMGRVISDGVSDAYIQDLTVKKAYRNRKVGKQILKALLHRLKQDGLGWVGLIAERGTHKFYERFGFRGMPDSVPMLKNSS